MNTSQITHSLVSLKMNPKLLELRPKRELLDPEFNGYKLSLDHVPTLTKELNNVVDRALPNTNQYSLLHAKLFGLHNHLVGETTLGETAVYFVDEKWTVQRSTTDGYYNMLTDFMQVWEIPNKDERESGDYNVCLKLVSVELAVVSDGTGMLYLLMTSAREDCCTWEVLFSDEVLGPDMSFVILDTAFQDVDGVKQVDVLLLRIVQENEHFVNIVNWVSLKESGNKWDAVALRELTGKGELNYCYFGKKCESLYVVSENGLKFTLDSENPILEVTEKNTEEEKKNYVWSQNKDEITVTCKLPEDFIKEEINVNSQSNQLSIKYKEVTFLNGNLYQNIDSNLTTYTTSNNLLEINLTKSETGLMWPELIQNDTTGEYLLDPALTSEIHERLAHLCNDSEVKAENGLTFNTQQIEECDFTDDKSSVLERISSSTHDITHRTHLGTHRCLLSLPMKEGSAPALGLRHDVDVCLWQPCEADDGDWKVEHVGTLLAFGYVQASKQQRKFLAVAPDLRYAVICESSRHIFVYCQNKPVTSGQLRNRTTGANVNTVAQQKVLTVPGGEIMGVYACTSGLYVLTAEYLMCYKL